MVWKLAHYASVMFMDLLHSLTGALIDRSAGMQQISLGDFNGWSYRATYFKIHQYVLLQSELRRLRRTWAQGYYEICTPYLFYIEAPKHVLFTREPNICRLPKSA